jgi:hypothetical protein
MKHEPFNNANYDAITLLPVTDRGDWVATSLGGMWSILHPHPRDVYIDDLAWGMARTCRYGGQLKHDVELYSVAEHATAMTWWAIENGRVAHVEDALAILLHDASEAFFGDIPTPIKKLLPDYKVMEDRAQQVITDAFGLTPQNTEIRKKEIKEIDVRIRIDERLSIIEEPALTAGLNVTWENDPDLQRLGVDVACMLPSQARASFMSCMTWVCQNFPYRDPSIAPLIDLHLSRVNEPVRGAPPRKMEVVESPFATREIAHHDDDAEITL